MNTEEAYNKWAVQYDNNENKTRDLEALALRIILKDYDFTSSIELGCGTGKNTSWLSAKSKEHLAVDFSEEMLAFARAKTKASSIQFIKADLTQAWNFGVEKFDLATFSLVLEHIENLDHIFSECAKAIKADGLLYIGELHPYKQYAGSKARFESSGEMHYPDCYTHSISAFIQTAKKNNFRLLDLNEFYDAENDLPRILTLLFKKDNPIPFTHL